MIDQILSMLELVKKDTKNLGQLSRIALGKNKLAESLKEITELIKL
tara:strand:- start:1112 stop:1249 length:138 start_codon:yes stop_codon:yes gene_type:complete